MATQTLKFIKGSSANSTFKTYHMDTANKGTILFDTNTKEIKVKNGDGDTGTWETFDAKRLKDASVSENVLTITKYDGSTTTFSVASLSSNLSTLANTVSALTTTHSDDIAAINNKIGGSYSSTSTVASAIDAAKKAGDDAQATIDAFLSGTNTSDAIDTLKEIQAYISEDKTGSASLLNTVNGHTTEITKLNNTINGLDLSKAPSVTSGTTTFYVSAVTQTNGQVSYTLHNFPTDTITSTGGSKVTVKVTPGNGGVASVSVSESDIASAQSLSVLTAKVDNLESNLMVWAEFN